jgi:hypothetical protein
MPNQTITQLPIAAALTGTEQVPIVQSGVTVQTTVGDIAAVPVTGYSFVTATSEGSLSQSRQLSTSGGGLTLTDNGAGSTLVLSLSGAAASLVAAGTGIQVKTSATTLTARSIAAGTTGLSVADGSGVAGNPTISLTGMPLYLAQSTGVGLLTRTSGNSVGIVTLQGTANEIDVSNGTGNAGDPTVGLADNPTIPGTAGMLVPVGTTGQRTGLPSNGIIRYNSTTQTFEGYANSAWRDFALTGGVTSFSAGTTGLTPAVATTGAVTLNGILIGANGGTGVANTGKTITLGGSLTLSGAHDLTLTQTGATNVTLPTTGTLATLAGSETLTNKTISGANNTLSNIGNASLTNSSVTYNGVTVALGASGTITAANPNALTVSTGLQLNSGTTYDGSAARTISIDSTVVTLTGSQVLTNKTINGPDNSLTNIANSSLANSSLTIGTTNIALGATSLTLAGLTSVTLTQNPTTALQAATKQYVDTLVASGITYHTPVKYKTPQTLSATYNNGSAGVGATLTNSTALQPFQTDGFTPSVGDRILVYNQTAAPEQNGVYTVTVAGDGSTAWVLTRATDADTYALKSPNGLGEGDAFFVTSGNTGAGETYVCNTVGTITFGTTAITFAQVSASQVYSAGTGLTLTNTTFSITNTGVSAATYGSASAVPVFAVNAQGQITSVTNTSIAIAASQVTSGTLAIAQGGTNGSATPTAGAVPYGSGTAYAFSAAGNASEVLLSGGTGSPTWAAQSSLSVGTATNAVNIGITDDTTTNATMYPVWVTANTGNLPAKVTSTKLSFNPSTGVLTATGGIAGGAF